MKRFLFVVFLVLICNGLRAQDSLVLDRNYFFKEGIFLNFEQVKKNSPIAKTKLITDFSVYEPDFFDRLVEQKEIKFYYYGQPTSVPVDKVWGYSDNGKLYINWNDAFNRIVVVGALGHFTAMRQVRTYASPYESYYDPYGTYSTTTSELHQYILDFRTGQVYEFTASSLLNLFEKYDKELYREFSAMSSRKRKKMLFVYLRKFNQRNKIYLPKP